MLNFVLNARPQSKTSEFKGYFLLQNSETYGSGLTGQKLQWNKGSLCSLLDFFFGPAPLFVHSAIHVCQSSPPSTHLSAVSDVDDDVGFLLKDSLVQGCEVRRVVGVAAVRLDDGQGDGLTRGEDDLTTLVQLYKAWEKIETENKERKDGWIGEEGPQGREGRDAMREMIKKIYSFKREK